MKNFKKKLWACIKITGLAFAIISGSAFVASGAGLIFDAEQRASSNVSQSESELATLKTEKSAGLGLMLCGGFIGLGKFYLAVGTQDTEGIGPTSKKLAQGIKDIYKNEIKQ